MTRISVVVITFNEERNIRRCLESVRDIADEIVVVDSFSTDKTREICESYGATFIQNKWPGYTQQKNFANDKASFDHILSLDADEALSEELKGSIRKIKDRWERDSYTMNRLTSYCGKWIRHGGWYPDPQTRLFNRTKGKWQGDLIHERYVPAEDASTGHLRGDLLHYSYHNINEHVRQANHYTDLTAEEAFRKGKKASFCKMLAAPVFKFIRDYFLKLGFLDGYYGFVVCRISAFATFLKYSKLRELRRRNKEGQK